MSVIFVCDYRQVPCLSLTKPISEFVSGSNGRQDRSNMADLIDPRRSKRPRHWSARDIEFYWFQTSSRLHYWQTVSSWLCSFSLSHLALVFSFSLFSPELFDTFKNGRIFSRQVSVTLNFSSNSAEIWSCVWRGMNVSLTFAFGILYEIRNWSERCAKKYLCSAYFIKNS